MYPTVEARDGMVESGMELGLREGYERLDALVALTRSRPLHGAAPWTGPLKSSSSR